LALRLGGAVMAGVNHKSKEIETKTLDNTIDKLTENLNLDGILDTLLAKELITTESHSELNKMLENGKRISAVRKCIEILKLNPPGFLKTFITVLKENKATGYLGDHIAEGQ